MSRVVARCGDVRLLLVGDGPERSAIEAEIVRLNLQDVVQLLGQRDDVYQLLSAADVAMLTSLSEGIPVTLIEAMAAGLPVVATRVGGVEEVVEEGQTGLMVSAGDDAGLARAVDTLACNPALRTQMGSCGIDRARRLFSDQQMLGAYRELYARMTQLA